MDAPPVLIDLDASVFCGKCANLCPVRAFRMAVKEKVPDTGKNTTDNVAEDVPMTETA